MIVRWGKNGVNGYEFSIKNNGEIFINSAKHNNRFSEFNKEEVTLLFECLHNYSYDEAEWRERKLNETLRRELMERLSYINKEEAFNDTHQ